jgi:hypothetical protein
MSAEIETPSPSPAPRLAEVESALADGLSDHLPGLAIVDRALAMPTGEGRAALRADLVAIDAFDRLVLISLVDGRADATAIDALEALSILRESRPLLAQHLRSPRVRSAGPLLLVLVAERFGERITRGLASVSSRELRLLEMREISSASGSRLYFAPIEPARDAHGAHGLHADGGRRPTAEPGSTGPVEAPIHARFLESVPELVRPAAELCMARIDRIDSELDRRPGVDLVSWRYRDRRLCSLVWTGERLFGQIEDEGGSVPLSRSSEIDPFVDRVVSAHLCRLEDGDSGARIEERSSAEKREEPGSELAEGVLLTPEEIAAFRD